MNEMFTFKIDRGETGVINETGRQPMTQLGPSMRRRSSFGGAREEVAGAETLRTKIMVHFGLFLSNRHFTRSGLNLSQCRINVYKLSK